MARPHLVAQGSLELTGGCKHAQDNFTGRRGLSTFWSSVLSGGSGMNFSERTIREDLFYCEFLLGAGDFHGASNGFGAGFKTFPIQVFAAFPVNVKMRMKSFGV
jgi:hypothetical protein